jgi:hypothetical protein
MTGSASANSVRKSVLRNESVVGTKVKSAPPFVFQKLHEVMSVGEAGMREAGAGEKGGRIGCGLTPRNDSGLE